MSHSYNLPSIKLLRWFVKGNEKLDSCIQLKLMEGPFSSRIALIAAGLNTILICCVAVVLHPTIFFVIWLAADISIWLIRWMLLLRFTSHFKSRSQYTVDLSLLFGLIWAAEIGIGTAGCIISSDPILQVLACTSAVSMCGAIAMRNQGIPRYAFAQILLTDLPMKFATLFQSEPMLRILILQAPMYLIGVWVLLNHLNSNLKKAYISEADSKYFATHDKLTGALNCQGVSDIFESLKNSGQAISSHAYSLLYLDLDGFKQINDNNGHSAGDDLLAYFSKMISSIIRENDHVGRIGGDEFIVLMMDVDVASASHVSSRIILTLKTYVAENKHLEGLGVSVGVAMHNTTMPESADQLIARADLAMYDAKSAGKNCYRFR